MRKTISGARYDTETARFLAAHYEGKDMFGGPDCYEELLYRTKAGKFFLYCSGESESKYSAIGPDGKSIPGERIVPISQDDAYEFVQKHCESKLSKLILSELRPDEVPVMARVSPEAKFALEKIKGDSCLSSDQVVNRALLVFYDAYFDAPTDEWWLTSRPFEGGITITDKSKVFTGSDGGYAVAECQHIREHHVCHVRTKGGMFYRASDFDEACNMAEELISAWNHGDYEIEDRPRFSSARIH